MKKKLSRHVLVMIDSQLVYSFTACCKHEGGNVDTCIYTFIDQVLWQHAFCQSQEQKCSLGMLRPKATVWFGERNLIFRFTDPPILFSPDW